MSQTKRFKVHLLQIKRGLEEIVHEYNDIEIAVLVNSHLPENIKILERDVGVVDLPNDANVVHAQLVRKFDTLNNQVVGRVFPAAATLSQHFGLALGVVQVGVQSGVKKSSQNDPGAEARKALARGENPNKPVAGAGGGQAKGGQGGKGGGGQGGKPADPPPPADTGAGAGGAPGLGDIAANAGAGGDAGGDAKKA